MDAREWLSMMPFRFRVEGGEALRAAVAELTRQLAAALADPKEPASPA